MPPWYVRVVMESLGIISINLSPVQTLSQPSSLYLDPKVHLPLIFAGAPAWALALLLLIHVVARLNPRNAESFMCTCEQRFG